MSPRRFGAVWLGAASLASGAACAGDTTIVVARDGRGDFGSIQQALDGLPAASTGHVTVLIRRGTYREKLYVTRSHLALVGEDRDSTRIVFAELRAQWQEDHGTDWGAAVVNLDSTVTDVTIAHLTVCNDYGSRGGDRGHQFAIRGGGTRVSLLYCTVASEGGDAVALWNRQGGMYYHAGCSFEGWVDFVCPRGWCYVTDSRFFGHNLSASIWHDGSHRRDQKFVIRRSSFEGVPGFSLGRHHRDAQFFLLECRFSRNMADRPVYRPASSTAPSLWGERAYYYDCHRDGGDFAWFRDNLDEAEGSPRASEVSPAWTFGGRWDPESSAPRVLPFAALPRPCDGARGVDPDSVGLSWLPSRRASAGTAMIGESAEPASHRAGGPAGSRIGPLRRGTTYHWHVREVVGGDTVAGPIWRFTTR